MQFLIGLWIGYNAANVLFCALKITSKDDAITRFICSTLMIATVGAALHFGLLK